MKRIQKLWLFLTNDIWRVTEEEVKPATFSVYNIIKTIAITINTFIKDRLTNKAAALTYSTLLATVPLLAIVFAIARGFGFDNFMENQLISGMGGQADAVHVMLQFVDSYLVQTKNGVFLGVGLILLLWTVLNLISNMEITFNRIWHINRQRTMFRKITDYFSMLLLIPIFIVVSGGLSIYIGTIAKNVEGFILLAPISKFLIRSIPYLFTCLIFTGLYVFLPNTKVQIKHALISGIIAGSAHQFLQYCYINGQLSVSKYNAIYGSFAALPLFLLWLQISWTICLFGAQLTYSGQNIRFYSFDKDTKQISKRYREFVTILIMSIICKRFSNGEEPASAEDIAVQCKIPLKLTYTILEDLSNKKLISQIAADEKSNTLFYQPAVDTEKLSVGYLMERIDVEGSEDFKIDIEQKYSKEWNTLVEAKEKFYDTMNGVLLKNL